MSITIMIMYCLFTWELSEDETSDVNDHMTIIKISYFHMNTERRRKEITLFNFQTKQITT